MKKQIKLISLIGTALLTLAVVFAATSCKQNGDDKKEPDPVATIKSADGQATLTILTLDKTTGKGTCKVDVPAHKYWAAGNFQATPSNISLSNTKDSLNKTGKDACDGSYPIIGGKVTIKDLTFDVSSLFN